MYRYNLAEYRTQKSVIWAAFFDKLGLNAQYNENNDGLETFEMPSMNLIAVIFDTEKYTVSNLQSFCIQKGWLTLDTGKLNASKGKSVVLLKAKPWEDDSCLPLCTVHSKKNGYQTLCPVDGSVSGTFMCLYQTPVFVMDNLDTDIHGRGYFVASHDLKETIPDTDTQNWTRAAKYAASFDKKLNNVSHFRQSLPEFHQGTSDDSAKLVSRPDGKLEIVSGKVMKAVQNMSANVDTAVTNGDEDVWNRLEMVCSGRTYDDTRSTRTVAAKAPITEQDDAISRLNATQDHLLSLMQAAINRSV